MPAYTWTTGETITAAKLNDLETEAYRAANQIVSNSSTSQSSTSSTSYVDAAASVTFTAGSSSVLILAAAGGFGVDIAAVAANVFLAVQIDGTDYAVCHAYSADTDITYNGASGSIVVTGLTPGASYTAKLRIKVDQATAIGYLNNSGSSRQTITVIDLVK